MNDIVIFGDSVFVGVCVFAAFQHGLVALRRPVNRTHLLFALLCLIAAVYFLDKLALERPAFVVYGITLRRCQVITGLTFFMVLGWFVAEYTGTRPRWLLAGLTVLILAAFFVHPLRPAGVAAVFAFSFYACVRQYRLGARRRAVTLGVGILMFLVFLALKRGVNLNYVDFYDVSEYGFLALIAVMSYNLMYGLRESELRLHSILDNIPAAIYMKDSMGRYQWANRQFEKWFNVTRSMLRGKTDSQLSPMMPELFSGINSQPPHTAQEPEVAELDVSKDGEMRTYSSLIAPLPQDESNTHNMCGILTDVTVLRQAEIETVRLRQQLWRADRLASISTLTASLAHELNQPLTAILSNAQAGIRFLGEQQPDMGEIRSILQDIVRDDRRASEVIAGLRNLLQRNEPGRSLIDLAAIAREVLQLLHTELLNAQIEVNTHFDEGCYIQADKALVQQVQLNLILNAIEAMYAQPPPQRRLDVSVTSEGDSTRKSTIRDQGTGIGSEGFKNLFSMYSTTKPKGMGMGLAICLSIIESHKGKIWAERNLDQGLTFFFTLPAAVNEGSA